MRSRYVMYGFEQLYEILGDIMYKSKLLNCAAVLSITIAVGSQPAFAQVEILIPPFTEVKLICKDNADASTFTGTANITGRVYA